MEDEKTRGKIANLLMMDETRKFPLSPFDQAMKGAKGFNADVFTGEGLMSQFHWPAMGVDPFEEKKYERRKLRIR